MAQLLRDNVYIRKGADSSFYRLAREEPKFNFDCFPSKQIFFHHQTRASLLLRLLGYGKPLSFIVCLPVRGDNPRALASGLSPI